MRIAGYRPLAAKDSETGGLRNVLAHLGVKAPHTGEPYTEEMLFGLGGGIWFGYMIWDICGRIFPLFGTRSEKQSFDAGYLQTICKRVGASTKVLEAGGTKAADANLRKFVEGGSPAFAWIGMAGLPYFGMPKEWAKMVVHVVVVYGIDDGQAWIDDRCGRPVRVSCQDLAVARSAITTLKHRVLAVQPPAKAADLKRSVREALAQCVQGLEKGKIVNFSLTGLGKWAELVNHPKDSKGWPKLLHPGARLYSALVGVFESLRDGAHRPMFASFLEEAAEVLRLPPLASLSESYRRVGDLWSELAHAALPEGIPAFRKTREVVVRRSNLFREKGGDAEVEMRKLWTERQGLEGEMAEAFPLSPDAVRRLLQDLKKKILEIHSAELGAVDSLRKVLGS